MTLQEAILFFPHQESDDIYDLYEERLFEYKQFFLSKVPIRKVFASKISKMKQMELAFTILGGEVEKSKSVIEFETFIFSDQILEAFRQFEILKNQLKSQITKALYASEIEDIVFQILHLQTIYIEKWIEYFPFTNVTTEGIIISKEPDQMELLEAIRQFNNAGGIIFGDFLLKSEKIPDALVNEMKRLYLHQKMEKNG